MKFNYKNKDEDVKIQITNKDLKECSQMIKYLSKTIYPLRQLFKEFEELMKESK